MMTNMTQKMVMRIRQKVLETVLNESDFFRWIEISDLKKVFMMYTDVNFYSQIVSEFYKLKIIGDGVSEYGCFPPCAKENKRQYCWFCTKNEQQVKEQYDTENRVFMSYLNYMKLVKHRKQQGQAYKTRINSRKDLKYINEKKYLHAKFSKCYSL